jgi:hypothetical protein
MTQKRKHKLERIIRQEYIQFVQVFVNFRKLQKKLNVEKFIKCS